MAERTYKAIGGGAYEQRVKGKATGRFYERQRGKRSLKLLPRATTRAQALAIVAARSPSRHNGSFAALAEIYRAAGCPNKRNQPYNPRYLPEETKRVDRLIEHFGATNVDDLRGSDWHSYYTWRVGTVRTGTTGFRTVDKERQTMRNIFNYACARGLHHTNPFAFGTTRYQVRSLVRHATVRAPANAETIHAIAAELFASVSTEVTGWVSLFAMFSGCRISELLRLRTDAKHLAPDRFEPGYIETRAGDDDGSIPRHFLQLGKRSKGGINPQVAIGEEFYAMLGAFQNWHEQRFPESQWYFPCLNGEHAKPRRMINTQLEAACQKLSLPGVTPHGYRSYFVSKHRSDQVPDHIIASWLGDKTVSLMQDTYGKIPDSWTGGSLLRWCPRKGEPAWKPWISRKPAHNRHTTETAETPNRLEINDAGVAKWQTHRT